MVTHLRTRNISRWLNSQGLGALLPTPPALNIWPWTLLFLPGPPCWPLLALSSCRPATAGEFYCPYPAVLLMCLCLLCLPPPSLHRLPHPTVVNDNTVKANNRPMYLRTISGNQCNNIRTYTHIHYTEKQ